MIDLVDILVANRGSRVSLEATIEVLRASSERVRSRTFGEFTDRLTFEESPKVFQVVYFWQGSVPAIIVDASKLRRMDLVTI